MPTELYRSVISGPVTVTVPITTLPPLPIRYTPAELVPKTFTAVWPAFTMRGR